MTYVIFCFSVHTEKATWLKKQITFFLYKQKNCDYKQTYELLCKEFISEKLVCKMTRVTTKVLSFNLFCSTQASSC